MNYYRYKAVDQNGKVISGYIQTTDEQAALNIISLRNFNLLSFSQVPKYFAPFVSFFSGKIKNIELIEFAKNISMMLKAGIPITIAIGDVAENLTNARFRSIVTGIKEMIEMGVSFSEAVNYHSDVFPPIFTHLIRIGEETGRLDKSLEDIAEHFQKIEDLKTAIKRALIYPIFATVASVGAMGFWIVFVLPKIVEAMKGMGVNIPFITRFLVEFGVFVKNFYYLFPIFAIVLFLLVYIFKENPKFRYVRAYLSFKVPIVKNIMYTRAVALFCEQMRILVGAGVPIDNSLDMTAQVVNNEIMSRAIQNAKEKIITGQPISESLKEEKIFPSLVIRLINVGESSGRLEEQLNFLNNYYTNYLQEYSTRLGKIIEPVMIGIIGLFFAIVLVSLLSPLYDLISKLGRG